MLGWVYETLEAVLCLSPGAEPGRMCALTVMCWKHEIKMLHMACGLLTAFIGGRG